MSETRETRTGWDVVEAAMAATATELRAAGYTVREGETRVDAQRGNRDRLWIEINFDGPDHELSQPADGVRGRIGLESQYYGTARSAYKRAYDAAAKEIAR